MLSRLLAFFRGGAAAATETGEPVPRYVGAKPYEVDRSVRPFDLYEFDAWEEDLSDRGLLVAGYGRDGAQFTAESIWLFRETCEDPELQQLPMADLAVAAIILAELGGDLRFPVDILVDPKALDTLTVTEEMREIAGMGEA